MRIHAIQTGLVQIKTSQVDGRGHGLQRQLAPLFDENWSGWLPTFAW
jgi:N-acyl homoserine lactone hydrolase